MYRNVNINVVFKTIFDREKINLFFYFIIAEIILIIYV